MMEQLEPFFEFIDKNRRLTGILVFLSAPVAAMALLGAFYAAYKFIAWWGARGYIFFL